MDMETGTSPLRTAGLLLAGSGLALLLGLASTVPGAWSDRPFAVAADGRGGVTGEPLLVAADGRGGVTGSQTVA